MSIQIGIRTVDGAIAPISADRFTVFTTAVDRQEIAVFEIFVRTRKNGPWTKLEEVSLEPLPPAPAGQPDLELRALYSSGGGVSLEVTDSFTGVPRSVLLPAARRHRRRRTIAAWAAAAVALAGVGGGLLLASGQRDAPGGLPAAERPLPRLARAEAAPASPKPQAAPPSPAVGAVPPPAAPSPQQQAPQQRPQPPQPPPAAAAADAEYRVVWGDTLWQIAERQYGDRAFYQDLAEANGLADPDLIIAGDTLKLPKGLAR